MRFRNLNQHCSWRFEFKRQDAWIGVFWKKEYSRSFSRVNIYICLIPLIPLHIHYVKWINPTRS